jgi:hypothetical protein
MSTGRKKHVPMKIRGEWEWVYRDTRRLAGIIQHVNDQWRAIRVGPDGRDHDIQTFVTREQAIGFVNNQHGGHS